LKTIGFISFFELGRRKEASRDPWGQLGDEKKSKKSMHLQSVGVKSE
jgi:hypothetical protein